jgi:hypothetical protein
MAMPQWTTMRLGIQGCADILGIHLTGKGRPSLQADVDQPQILVQEVVVQDTLRYRSGDETRPTFTGDEFEGWAGFHHAQDTDKPLGNRGQGELLFGPDILVDVAGTILPGTLVLLSIALRVFNQTFRPFGTLDFQEVHAADLQTIDEILELRGTADG